MKSLNRVISFILGLVDGGRVVVGDMGSWRLDGEGSHCNTGNWGDFSDWIAPLSGHLILIIYKVTDCGKN